MSRLKLANLSVSVLAALLLSGCAVGGYPATLQEQADNIVKHMSTRDKIGQKIVMAFQYWCPDQSDCTQGLTVLPDSVADALRSNAIGGVILQSHNLIDLDQTQKLLDQFKRTVAQNSPIGMLIGTDEEGGSIFRLPRAQATPFPGNMALGAAYEATRNDQLAYDEGRVLATEIAALGFNVNFAPDVDVNSNPLNPVINVRSYGDDPAMVSLLGRRAAQGMADQGVIGVFKHYPGHGDTATDSHYGLPIVKRSRDQAEAIDIAPYRLAIEAGQAPDMIMTAHIQYPALDTTRIDTRSREQMIVPATMSRKIQHDRLRGELAYRGVTITDALDMQGISDYFEPSDAVIKVFQADVDIALMPVEFRTAADAHRLSDLIDRLVAAVNSGLIDRKELDRSVSRIVLMKLRHGITPQGNDKPAPDRSVIGSPEHRAIERSIAQQAITLLRNQDGTLPLRAPLKAIFILTPWAEQAQAMRRRFVELGDQDVTSAALSTTSWSAQKSAIDAAQIVILGTQSSGITSVRHDDPPQEDELADTVISPRLLATPPASDAQRLRDAMEYAKARHKTVIHLTMRTPYDVTAFDDIADATLASYSYTGSASAPNDTAMTAVVDVILGVDSPIGRLPVAIYTQNPDGTAGALRYPRGFGLRY